MTNEEKYGRSPKDGLPISAGDLRKLETPADFARYMGITEQQWLNRVERTTRARLLNNPEGEA